MVQTLRSAPEVLAAVSGASVTCPKLFTLAHIMGEQHLQVTERLVRQRLRLSGKWPQHQRTTAGALALTLLAGLQRA